MADRGSAVAGVEVSNDYPLVFTGRVHQARRLVAKSTGNEFGLVTVYGVLLDSTGVEVLELPSYDVIVDADLVDRVRRGSLTCPARLETVVRDGRSYIALRLGLEVM